MTAGRAQSRRRGRGSAPGGLLVEREAELASLGRRLAGARDGEGGVVFIEAAAGRGKSRLLAAAAEMARDAEMRVLEARGGELERDFPFGLAIQLFEPAWLAAGAARRARLLEGPARWAGELMTGSVADGSPFPGDRGYVVIHGLFWLACNLAAPLSEDIEGGPLSILVDDVHWADWPSVRFLAYLAERIADLPIALVVAARDGEPMDDRRALSVLRGVADDAVLRLDPLSEEGVAAIVKSEIPDAEPPFWQACARVTNGNPFLLVELLEEVRERGAAPDQQTATRLAELAPESVLNMVISRLGAMPAEVSALVSAVAVLGDGTSLRHGALVADLDIDAASRAADTLAAVHLFHPSTPLSFVHPLIASAVRASMSALERGQVHRRAATILSAEGAPEEQVALHLLAAPPQADPRAVEVLRTAARTALAGGAPESAVRMLERALSEGPEPDIYPDVLAELGHAELAAGIPDALLRIEDAIIATDERSRRAQLALAHARALSGEHRYRDAAAVLAAGLDELDGQEAELADDLEAAYIAAASFVPELGDETRVRGQVMLSGVNGRPTALQRVALAHMALQSSLRGGNRAAIADLAELSWGDGALLGAEQSDAIVWPLLAGALLFVDELERNIEICDAALLAAGEHNSPGAYAAATYCRIWTLYNQGRVTDAFAGARAALNARRGGWDAHVGSACGAIAACQLQCGQLDEAEDTLSKIFHPGEIEEIDRPVLLDVRAQLRLAQLRPREALEDALEAGRLSRSEFGAAGPGVIAWRSTAALAQLALGERAAALRLAGEELALARKSDVTRVIIRDLRVLGLAERGKRQLDLLGEAVSAGEDSPPRLEYIHALIDFGAAVRRSNQRTAAREPLRRGLELSHHAGASALEQRARSELAATGARPRRVMLSGVEALTPSERRVADLAAEGHTTRQMADALFVTPKTVEFHLRHVYRKLDVASSRAELKKALQSEPPA